MNLQKAIEILQINFGGVQPLKDPDLSAAAKLGIEALKRCKVLAENSPLWAAKPLPGETKK